MARRTNKVWSFPAAVAFVMAVATPLAVAAQGQAPVAPVQVQPVTGLVFFADGEAVLGTEADGVLDALAASLSDAAPGATIQITGFMAGSELDQGLVLADQRAATVAGALAERGVDVAQVVSVSGAANIGASTMFGDDLMSRRAEIVILSASDTLVATRPE